jgi:hypothetical protein
LEEEGKRKGEEEEPGKKENEVKNEGSRGKEGKEGEKEEEEKEEGGEI